MNEWWGEKNIGNKNSYRRRPEKNPNGPEEKHLQ
jgi:hypothetical protein